jgi:ATP-binding cassette subfamily F protein 3
MILQIKDIKKSFGEDEILKRINIKIEDGEKIGLVGENGAGKTTIFKIISKEISYDKGSIFLSQSADIGYLKQVSQMNESNTVWNEVLEVYTNVLLAEEEMRFLEKEMAKEDIYLYEDKLQKVLKKYDELSDFYEEKEGFRIESKIKGVLKGLGFSEESYYLKVNELSGGQKTKLGLAKLLLKNSKLLLLDEPTNHLDFSALKWLEGYIKQYKGAVIVISHDRYFIDSVSDNIYEIERGESKKYSGNYSYYIKKKAENKTQEVKNYYAQQKEIKKLETYIDKNLTRASTSKMAKSRRKKLEKIDRLDKPVISSKSIKMNLEINKKSHADVLYLKNADICVGEDKERVLLSKNVEIELKRNDKLALMGPNGIGKSTLLKTLIKQNKLDKGTLNWGEDVVLGYYDQEHNVLNENKTIYEELRDAFPKINDVEIRNVLGRFLFTKEDVFKKIKVLSGGEKSKVILAKLTLNKVNVLLLDEPTNHLDLKSKQILESALIEYEGTVLFVSHDRYFINKVANKTVWMNKNGVKMFNGNYDDFVNNSEYFNV